MNSFLEEHPQEVHGSDRSVESRIENHSLENFSDVWMLDAEEAIDVHWASNWA